MLDKYIININEKDGIFVYCWAHPFFNCLKIEEENNSLKINRLII
ncbi:MAG: hypothetical protein RR290_02455 [Clostridia bacterium]